MNETTELSFDRVLMDGIQDMVFVIRVSKDSIYYYDFLNRAAMDGTGLTQRVLGQSIRDVYPEKMANFLYDQYNKVVTSLEGVTYEDSYESPLGERYYSKTRLTPLLDSSGKCSHIVASVQDITEKKWADFELKEYWHKINESRQRYRSLFHYNSDAIFSIDLKGYIVDGNDTVESITGYLLNDLIECDFISLVVPDDVDMTKKHFQQALEGSSVNYQTAMLKTSGERIEIIMKFTPIILNKKVVGVYGVLKDMTEHVKLTKKNLEIEQRFRIIAEHAQDLILLLDEKGKINYAAPSHKNVLGFRHEEYIGKFFFHNGHPDDSHIMEETILQSIRTGQPWKLRIRKRHRTKGWIWFETQGTPVFDDENQFIHMVCVSRNIHLQKEYETNLKYFAYHDSLTELPNRRLFKERLMHALNEFQEKRNGLAVIMIDIDHFKSINDQMGHDIGDMVIAELSKRISNNIRNIDTVARLGGDEFIILLPSIGSRDCAVAMAEKIQKAMHGPWDMDGYVLEVTISQGIAMAPEQGATVSTMLKDADVALYKAKEAGRDSYKLS